jgi:activating signal cointegrator complex subunit 2
MPVTTTVFRLPPYPSTQSRKTLSPSQLSSLYKTISSALLVAVSSPPEKRDTLSLSKYIATYVKDVAFHTLQNIIWNDVSKKIDPLSPDEKLIQSHSLRLAEKLASSPPGLDIQTLLDLSIIYSRIYPSQLHTVFQASLTSDSELPKAIAKDLIPCFTLLLTQRSPHSQGLYAQRKTAECVYTFLRACKGSPRLIRPFVHDKEFILALASLYDVGMIAICASYGGIPALMSGITARDREADDWERIWVETKVALIDSFHIILSTLLDDLASTPTGTILAAEAERAFDIVFTLLDVSTSSSSSTDTAPIPFLNQSLLADYQQAYTLSKSLASSLKHAEEKDARLDLLESMLDSLDTTSAGRDSKQKDAGALKILLRSAGSQPGIDSLGKRNLQSRPNNTDVTTNSSFMSTTKNKGKARAAPLPPTLSDTDLDIKATQVLDILPDISTNHVKLLLMHGGCGGNPEKVIEALLEGTAMSEEDLEQHLGGSQMTTVAGLSAIEREKEYDVSQRKNVFDGEALDISKLRLGKKDVRLVFLHLLILSELLIDPRGVVKKLPEIGVALNK